MYKLIFGVNVNFSIVPHLGIALPTFRKQLKQLFLAPKCMLKVMENFSLSPLRARKRYNYRYLDRVITMERAIKKESQPNNKNKSKKIKSDNFKRSHRKSQTLLMQY